MIRRLVAFGDDYGMPMLLRHIPRDVVAAMVVAAIRPGQHDVLAQCAASHGVPLLVQPKRDAPDYPPFVERVRSLAPDFFLVNSYSMRIGAELLRAAPFGGVNVHGAILPEFRGANPIQWALIGDERETGVTIHRLTEDIDAGAIVAQRKVPVFFRDTWLEIRDRIAQATETLLSESLPAVLNQTAPAVPQDSAKAHYYRRRNPEDGKIDWAKRVLDIYNLIRALVEPHPGAYYESASGRVWIRQYMSIQEVAAVKYSILQKSPIAAEGVQFSPSVSGQADDGANTFAFEGDAGRVCLLDIDWEARTARTEISIEPKWREISVAVERAAVMFARDQLGLRSIAAGRQGVRS